MSVAAKKPAPVRGHRCKGPLVGVTVRCECGWSSATWYGEGARRNAYGEWRGHVEKCQEAAR